MTPPTMPIICAASSARRLYSTLATVLALLFGVTASDVFAETLLMPNRDMLMSPVSEVVWGVTTLPNWTAGSPTTYTINFGDGSAQATGNVTDQSYIALNHQFIAAGTFTVTMLVTNGGTTETATTTVRVFDPAHESAERIRGVNTNRAIEDGLRWLWTAQSSRNFNFPNGTMTNWGETAESFGALIVLAFENHGYHLPNNDTEPTGIYEKYIVRRGMNFVINQLQQFDLTAQPAGDPCVNVSDGPAPCVGLRQGLQSEGYATALAILPLAASNALNRHVSEITGTQNGGFVVGKTYGEVLQRLVNAMAWGQGEAGLGRGGWYYSFNAGGTDGSTIGWNVLALLDAAASGITVPAFVKTEFVNFAIPFGLNMNPSGPNTIDGTFDYSADNNPSSGFGGTGGPNMAKNGIGLQAMFYSDMVGLGDAQVARARNSISARWNGAVAGDTYACFNGLYNHGCGYAMFNVFKALKLQGITTLPSVTRPAGPGTIPAGDWYADYVDWLLANQTSPTNVGGGYWSNLAFSCCGSGTTGSAALAELILSPVALIAPDPTLFSTVGLAPASALRPLNGSHTVTATATSAGGAAVAGATVNFQVLTGPNTGATGQAVTNGAGQAAFTYNDTGGSGRDTIQAFIGTLGSNIVEALWQVPDCNPQTVSAVLSSPMYPIDQGFRNFSINGAPGATITQVCQDEAPNFENIAAWAVDAQGVGTSSAAVRSQRSGTRTAPGNGRVYHVYFTSNACTGHVTIPVPTTAGGAAVDNGPLFNSVTGASCAVPTVPSIATAPNVVGDTQAVASQRILAANLTVGTISQINHPTIPAGNVISQLPAGGATAAMGSAIALSISAGPSSVVVPNVVGQPQTSASNNVSGTGLVVTIAPANNAVIAPGLVISQAPVAGTHVPPGSGVTLTVSLGPATSTVPNVVGLPLAGAVSTVGGSGLNFGTVDLVYNPVVPDGRVISQTPAPGTNVAPGSFVNFTLSLGPQPVVVPNVVGQLEAAAGPIIVGGALVVGNVTHVNHGVAPAGQVFQQTPPAGGLALPGSSVNLTVSLGPVMVNVPNVVGQAQGAAQTAITTNGLAVGTVTSLNHPTVPVGTVISQNPAGGPGIQAVIGSSVSLNVSLGPTPVAVPNVVGQPQGTASTNITGATLVVGTTTTQNHPTVPAGNVISQAPIAGTMVLPGSGVNIVVSLGPVMVAVPNVVGNTEANAVAALQGVQFAVGITYGASATVTAGNVISQNPSGGNAAQGSVVDIVVSTGPVVAHVPNVLGQPQATATSNIIAATLVVGDVTTQHSQSVPSGSVISQSPVGGLNAAPGSDVDLVISLGPAPAVPASLEVQLSSLVVGSGGTVNITPNVFDGLQGPINPAPPVTYQLLPGAGAAGTAPSLNGAQVFTSADTRGQYVVRGTIDGTSITGQTTFVVFNGSAQATNAAKFVKLGAAENTVKTSLDALLLAYGSFGPAADVTAARTAMSAALGTVPITGRRAMTRSTAVAAEVGFVPDEGAIAAQYPLTAHDVAFGNLVQQIHAKLDEISAFYATVSPDATVGGTNSVQQINALNGQLQSMLTQLSSLTVTPRGIVHYAPYINRLMGDGIPEHLHALTNRAISIAQQYPDPANVPVGIARLPGAQQFFAGLNANKSLITPGTFYGKTQPAFFGLLGMMGGLSLQMNLVNRLYGEIMWEVSDMISVLAAHGLLSTFVNNAFLTDIVSGASLSFHAPGLGGSQIEAFGVDTTDVRGNETWFIGTEAFSAARGVIENLDPRGIDSIQKLWEFFDNLADAVGTAQEAYENAHTQPDSLWQGYCLLDDSFSCTALVFDSGFPDVTTGRFPAPVIVLVNNKNNGSYGFGIFNFVP